MKKLAATALCLGALLVSCGGGTPTPETDSAQSVESTEPAEASLSNEPEAAPPAPAPAVPEPIPAPTQGEGMQITESGLKYEVLTLGDGAKPTLEDMVTVHYRGELTDGTVFDSSYDRGQPATFPLARVVKGWQEGVQLMPVGSKFRFEIPPDLGYGSRGAGATIPPNSTLIFQVELLGIN